MSVNNGHCYCGSLSQSGTRWSLYMEIHFESVDPTEMCSDFGLSGFTLNIGSPENRLAECSVRFIYIQHRAVLDCLFGDGRQSEGCLQSLVLPRKLS